MFILVNPTDGMEKAKEQTYMKGRTETPNVINTAIYLPKKQTYLNDGSESF